MKTRLAPSPTGALHLGNARTFIINWAMARQRGWQIVLRIDDLDGPRVKSDATQQAIELLRWLGIDWDEGPYYQSQQRDAYRQALEQLLIAKHIYPCRCTRSEIQAANRSAPHLTEHELRYPGTCRVTESLHHQFQELTDPELGWRVRVPDGVIDFFDQFQGPAAFDVSAEVGDFLVSTKSCIPSYQLAVVVDDHLQQIECIVRGEDLLPSTARQLLLIRHLNFPRIPQYWHLPLVIGEDGLRLAKRHGDTRLAEYFKLGIRIERILGLLAEWCGIGQRQPTTAAAFLDQFRLENLPPQPITFSQADDEWIRRKHG